MLFFFFFGFKVDSAYSFNVKSDALLFADSSFQTFDLKFLRISKQEAIDSNCLFYWRLLLFIV
jgi:hypothetical protein